MDKIFELLLTFLTVFIPFHHKQKGTALLSPHAERLKTYLKLENFKKIDQAMATVQAATLKADFYRWA